MKWVLCCIDGCGRPIRSVGFCSLHYNRFNLYGHPLAGEIEDCPKPRLPLKKEKQAWHSMKKRCYDLSNRNYPCYGGRGIRVCDRWLESFDNFLKDLGPAPDGYSLERIDVNGHYEPLNCKWATIREQNRNRTDTVLTEEKVKDAHRRLAQGENLADLAREFGVSYNTLYQAKRGKSWAEFKPEGSA